LKVDSWFLVNTGYSEVIFYPLLTKESWFAPFFFLFVSKSKVGWGTSPIEGATQLYVRVGISNYFANELMCKDIFLLHYNWNLFYFILTSVVCATSSRVNMNM